MKSLEQGATDSGAVRRPQLLVFPSEKVRAVDCVYGERLGRSDSQAFKQYRLRELRPALLERYHHDAFFVCYSIPDGRRELPRLSKAILPDLISAGLEPVLWAMALDLDNPGHRPHDNYEAAEAAIKKAVDTVKNDPVLGSSLIYATRGGLRLVLELATPIPASKAEPYIKSLIQHAQRLGLDPDQSCSDWTRFFRVPRGCREQKDQDLPLHDEDWAPVDIEKALIPVESERPKTVPAVVKPIMPENQDKLSRALRQIPSESNETWQPVCMALHHQFSGSEHGWKILDLWSQESAKYDRDSNRGRWDSLTTSHSNPTTLASLFALARKHGWREESDKPSIAIRPGQIHKMVAAAERALIKQGQALYQRHGRLVQVLEASGKCEIDESRIHLVTVDLLTSLLSECADWHCVKKTARGEHQVKPADPPVKVVKALHSKGNWALPELRGLRCAPSMLSDGRILERSAYDSKSGLYVCFDDAKFSGLSRKFTRSGAAAALAELRDLLFDFPFESEVDLSVALAAIMTLTARTAFNGPSPMFLFDSHTPGCGKSMLADLAGIIATGRSAPRLTQGPDEETRKKITSCLMADEPLLLIDNVSHRLGGASLDAALTSSTWSDRALGGNQMIKLPMKMVFMATGNNVQIGGDLARRILRCRLDPKTEFPETRTAFRHQNLLERVRRDRPRYLVSILKILQAFQNSGAQGHNSSSFGSFEAWRNLIAAALVWLDLPDPVESQKAIKRDAEPEREAVAELMQAWMAVIGPKPMTAKQLLQRAKNGCDGSGRLMEAIESALDGEPTPKLFADQILGRWKGRIVGGLRISKCKRHEAGARWQVQEATVNNACS